MVFALALMGACIIGPKQDDPAGADYADTGGKELDGATSDEDAFSLGDVGAVSDATGGDTGLTPSTDAPGSDAPSDAIADTTPSDAPPSDGAVTDSATDAAPDPIGDAADAG